MQFKLHHHHLIVHSHTHPDQAKSFQILCTQESTRENLGQIINYHIVDSQERAYASRQLLHLLQAAQEEHCAVLNKLEETLPKFETDKERSDFFIRSFTHPCFSPTSWTAYSIANLLNAQSSADTYSPETTDSNPKYEQPPSGTDSSQRLSSHSDQCSEVLISNPNKSFFIGKTESHTPSSQPSLPINPETGKPLATLFPYSRRTHLTQPPEHPQTSQHRLEQAILHPKPKRHSQQPSSTPFFPKRPATLPIPVSNPTLPKKPKSPPLPRTDSPFAASSSKSPSPPRVSPQRSSKPSPRNYTTLLNTAREISDNVIQYSRKQATLLPGCKQSFRVASPTPSTSPELYQIQIPNLLGLDDSDSPQESEQVEYREIDSEITEPFTSCSIKPASSPSNTPPSEGHQTPLESHSPSPVYISEEDPSSDEEQEFEYYLAYNY